MTPKYDKSQIDAKGHVEKLLAQSANPNTHWYGQWRSRLVAGELTTDVQFQEQGIHGIKEVDDDGQALCWCGLTSDTSGGLMLEPGHLFQGEIVTIFDWLLIPKPYGKTTVICQECTEQWPYETRRADIGEHVCRLSPRGVFDELVYVVRRHAGVADEWAVQCELCQDVATEWIPEADWADSFYADHRTYHGLDT